MKQHEVPDELIEIGACGGMGVDLRTALARILPAYERMVRAQVAEQLRAAAMATSPGAPDETIVPIDALAAAIWERCRVAPDAPWVVDDPRRIASVVYRHIADRLDGGES